MFVFHAPLTFEGQTQWAWNCEKLCAQWLRYSEGSPLLFYGELCQLSDSWWMTPNLAPPTALWSFAVCSVKARGLWPPRPNPQYYVSSTILYTHHVIKQNSRPDPNQLIKKTPPFSRNVCTVLEVFCSFIQVGLINIFISTMGQMTMSNDKVLTEDYNLTLQSPSALLVASFILVFWVFGLQL